MIDILTVSCGRNLYLERLLASIERSLGQAEVLHHVVNNGITQVLPSYVRTYNLGGRQTVGSVMEFSKNFLGEGLMVKLDDDAEIVSRNFFDTVAEIARLKPDAIFSPFPVGLINNLGGPAGKGHEVIYSEKFDRYFTLRKVNHIGGFARVMPTRMFKNVDFEDAHNEDVNVSSWAKYNGVEMFYLESGLIVEHQESTLGQHARDEGYFQGRF